MEIYIWYLQKIVLFILILLHEQRYLSIFQFLFYRANSKRLFYGTLHILTLQQNFNYSYIILIFILLIQCKRKFFSTSESRRTRKVASDSQKTYWNSGKFSPWIFPFLRFYESCEPTAWYQLPATRVTTKMLSFYVIEYRLCVETSSCLLAWSARNPSPDTKIPMIYEKERFLSKRSVKSLLV